MYIPIYPSIHHLVSAYLCRYLSYIIDLSIIYLSINHIASVIYLFIFIYGHEYKILYIM